MAIRFTNLKKIKCWTFKFAGSLHIRILQATKLLTMEQKKWPSKGQNLLFKLPCTDLSLEANNNLNKGFKEYLEESAAEKGSVYFNHFHNKDTPVPKKPWFDKLPLSRNSIVTISRIRSNHYNLNYSLYRKNMINSPACTCGDSRQDINHILFYYPITSPQSSNLRKYLKEKYLLFPIDTFQILKCLTPKLCRLITAFLNSNSLNI